MGEETSGLDFELQSLETDELKRVFDDQVHHPKTKQERERWESDLFNNYPALENLSRHIILSLGSLTVIDRLKTKRVLDYFTETIIVAAKSHSAAEAASSQTAADPVKPSKPKKGTVKKAKN